MRWLDDMISEWHTSPDEGGVPLWEWLGMTPQLYARYVEKEPVWVVGIDEVGYGALAGPLVIGAVLALANWDHPALKDSKAFRGSSSSGEAEHARARVLAQLAEAACTPAKEAVYLLHRTPCEEVDRVGVYQARLKAFSDVARATLAMVPTGSAMVVIDGDVRAPGLEHVCLPKADSFVPQVSAASIVAKAARDTEMRSLDKVFPEYGFGKHKGYGSLEHQEAIRAYGLCPIHRKSYKMKFLRTATGSSPSQT